MSRMSRMRSLARTFSRLVLPNLMRFFLCCAGSTSHQQWHQNDDGSNFINAIITAWAKKLSSTLRCSLRSFPIIIFVTISTVFTITQSTVIMPLNALSDSDATHASPWIGVAGVAICVAQLIYVFSMYDNLGGLRVRDYLIAICFE